MGVNLMKSEAKLEFHLNGESSIDAEILSKTIHDMAELTKAAAHEIDPEAYLKMNVTAFKNGSFQIDFSAICEAARNLFTPENINMAANIVASVTGFFEIKKHLKGKSPKRITDDGDEIRVENNEGQIISVPKSSQIVVNNIKIDQLVMNVANDVASHSSNGFSIKNGDKTTPFNPEDVTKISKPLPIVEETTCKRYITDVILPIKKADVLGKSAWGFIHNKRAITATIEDDAFIEKVHSGAVSIHAGDYIEATMQTYVDLNEKGIPIEDTYKYTILAVKGDIKNDISNIEQLNFLD